MAMALSPLHSEFRWLSSPSSYSPSSLSSRCVFILICRSQSISYKSVRSQKLRISCCNQTVQLDEDCQESSLVKKKKKIRPSFLEQVQKKWSLKSPSFRENFPWQEEGFSGTNPESSTEGALVPVDVKEQVKCDSVCDGVNSDTNRNSNLAPSAHGKRLRKNVVDSDGKEFEEIVVQEKEPDRDRIHDRLDGKEILFDAAGGYENLELTGVVEQYDEIEKVESLGFPDKDEISKIADETIDFSLSDSSSSADEDDTSASISADVNEQFIRGEKSRNRNTMWAERHIPEPELKRLRNLSLRMVERIKVGAAGVTQTLLDSIQENWRNQELVKLKFEGPSSENMKRIHEILESRTGGIIIWRSGSSVVLYRGMTYNLDCVNSYGEQVKDESGALRSSQSNLPQSIKFKDTSLEEQTALAEVNLLLDELGPRFADWQGGDPIPVDADLLPAVVSGYKTPFRLQPYRTRRTLADSEMTFLRRMARNLPPHFALGRNRGLQGLAAAMVKLWEKSGVVVVAIKRGVLNTHNERMAEELKILTGGTLLSRNKEFIVFYRGNDFLPASVSSALTEAEKTAVLRQDVEEQTRNRFATLIDQKVSASEKPLVAGTLAETVAATSRWGGPLNDGDVEKSMKDAVVARHASLLNSLQRKLALAKEKIKTAEKVLQRVLRDQEPEHLPTDLETLTHEERNVLRRIGMSMKASLLLGRREIFDGTIENMHLHWKHRELVKIIVKRKSLPQVKHIAISLEAESGGVLVSVERIPNGNHVIIVYRGKNYLRPSRFRPASLLSKRQALARSIELQRREALRHHVIKLEEKIEKMKQEEEEIEGGNYGSAASRLHLYAASSDEEEFGDLDAMDMEWTK